MKRTLVAVLSIVVTVFTFFATDALAMYHSGLGRFMQRDPQPGVPGCIGADGAMDRSQFIQREPSKRHFDEMSLYQYVQSDPINRTDSAGLWSGKVHAELTHAGLMAVDAEGLDPPPFPFADQVLAVFLNAANAGQDPAAPLVQHYNRGIKQGREEADRAYGNFIAALEYLIRELDYIPDCTRDAKYAEACRKILEFKGKQDHAFQDFFSHAIARQGETFEAFSKGIKGTPMNRARFWPSSYSLAGGGEHPSAREPVAEGTEEWTSRYNAAKDFMESDYKTFIPYWWSKCGCLLVLGKLGQK